MDAFWLDPVSGLIVPSRQIVRQVRKAMPRRRTAPRWRRDGRIRPVPELAVAFVNKNTGVVQAGTSFSSSFSVTAGGTNLCAFCPVAFDNATGLTITAPAYGGRTMTACGAVLHNTSSNIYVQWFYLVNPPTGSNTLTIAGSGTGFNEIYANLIVFQGVHQTTPVRPGSYTTSNIGTAPASIVIPSNASDMTVSMISTVLGSQTTNQTLDNSNTGGSNSMSSDHCTTPAASVTHTWSGTDGPIAGFSIQVAGATLLDTRPDLMHDTGFPVMLALMLRREAALVLRAGGAFVILKHD